MDGFPGGQSDWATTLQMLKSDDEFVVYSGVMTMRDSLSYAQENQMQGFMTEQFMDILVKIVARDAVTDLSNEVKFFAVQCLTTLMDIFPSLVNGLVHAGLVTAMAALMQGSFGFIDLSEACIKAYEKIVQENPPAVLRSGAVGIILQQMDFLESSTQQRIFRIIQKVARHSTTEADFDRHILPIMPFICVNLHIDSVSGDQNKIKQQIEDVSKIVSEFQESFCIFYSPSNDFQKVGLQFDKLLECGVYDIILGHIRQYSEISLKIQAARSKASGGGASGSLMKQDAMAMEIDGEGQIDSANQNHVLTHQTILNFFKILENACRYSSKVANKLFGTSTLLRDLGPFLPHDSSGTRKQYNTEDFPLTTEVINLLSSVFSEKQKGENSSLKDAELDVLEKRLLGKKEYETQKREFQLASSNRDAIIGIAQDLLPRIFLVYDQSTINPQFRIRILQVIDKIIALFNDELLKNFIEPDQFANFIFQILLSKHSSSIDVSLKITKKVMDCSPETYAVPFIREGVSQLISDIATEQGLKAFLGVGKDVDIHDQAFDLDIHELKEALHFTRISNPDDHATRDFYERKLLELVEFQKHHPDKTKKQSESEKDIAGKSNLAIQIIEQAKAILVGYFENKDFIANLEKFSPQTKQQLNMLAELKQLSSDLCYEATQTQHSVDAMTDIRRLLTRMSELLTLEQCAITSYEYKRSELPYALELLLTKSPSQAKIAMEKKKSDETGEEMKRAEEIDMIEAQKQSKSLSKKESRCIMNRLKLFAHILLIRKGSSGLNPMRTLIELNHKVISENDSFILSGKDAGGHGLGGSGGLHGQLGGGIHGGMGALFGSGSAGSAGDYDHCISALRQLQKRVTVNLIYDPKKQNQKPIKSSDKQASKQIQLQQILSESKPKPTESDDLGDFVEPEDSQMEDLTPESQDGNVEITPAIKMKKGQSQAPSLMSLAGSPGKGGILAPIEQQKINSSKVYTKRHYLYNELGQIPVTVEQSSCLQILEDFLRNRIKTVDHVKGLKFDYGLGGLGGFGAGGPPGSSSNSPFGGAFGGHYQAITQKILRKNLGNGAKKLLDRANERLAKILNTGPEQAFKIKQANKKPKKIKKVGAEGYGDEMEGVEGAEKSVSDDEEHSGGPDHDSDDDSGGSDGYGDMDEDEEEEQEMVEMEKQRLLDIYVEELPDEIINSDVPEEQQHMLVKILTRQHAFMIDQLKMNCEDATAVNPGGEETAEIAAAREEDMYRLEERLEDFQETMERVQARFVDKKALQGDSKKKKTDGGLEEEKKSGETGPKKLEQIAEHAIQNDSDEEMADQTHEAEEQFNQNKLVSKAIQEALDEAQQPQLSKAENTKLPTISMFIGQIKLSGNTKDTEMMKPAELSDPELQNDNEMEEDSAQILIDTVQPDVKKEGFEDKKKSLEQMLAKEFEEQDKKIQKALLREKELRQKIKEVKNDIGARKAEQAEDEGVSAQTEELLVQDLEELIKQQGEDIDFEFWYEGKQIWANQSIFEIVKDGEKKRRHTERIAHKAEQVRVLQEKEEELRRRTKKLAEAKGAETESERNKLKKESERLKELFTQLSSQFGASGGLMRGGAPGFLTGMNAHKIYFCIKDRADEVAELKRQRLDSLAELTNSAQKRARTKSEAIKDISSSSINEFVTQILQREFKVFDDEPEENEEADEQIHQLKKIDEEMNEEKVINSSSKETRKTTDNKERNQLGQSLKILKVLNFLFANQDLISSKGIRFVMKASQTPDEDTQWAGSPSKNDDPNSASDYVEPGFSDLDLKAGFAELQASFFHHHKLDSYLQKSIKDPYNLVQGAISTSLQQIFQNCPFLFPFSTKQLYFKLVSFISAIDVHRAIYFLRQYLKQSGSQKVQNHDKDNLKKIAKQKVLIQRDKLIASGFALIQKIDKRSFLEFEFQGEEGTGLGPTLEFYDNIAEEFKKWSTQTEEGNTYSMWRLTGDNLLFPGPACLKSLAPENIKQIYEIFRLCGTIVAKAIVDDRQIDLPISPLFWRLCMGTQMSIFDMQKLDQTIFNTLAEFQVISTKAEAVEKNAASKNLSEDVKNRQLQGLTIANGSRVEDYAMAFTLPCFDHIELIPGGKDRDVTLDNAQDFVDLVLHSTFHETVKLQVSAFKKGFNSIFPISSLAPFCHASSDGSDLEQIVCGSASTDADWTQESLLKNIEPDHGYTRKSPQYLHFLRYISEIEPNNRPMFLKFLTGSKRLPIGGFASLTPHLTLVLKKENPGQHPDMILPSVMACQNYVKSPIYSSFDIFKLKFDYAVQEGQQNFTLS